MVDRSSARDTGRSADGVLQLCPHDHPPFADLCVVYAQALRSLGLRCTTVFFAPPLGTPVKGAIYLNASSLRDTRALARELDDQLHGHAQWRLVICHRYRSWRVLKASTIETMKTVAVAHEFHFFDKTMRKLMVRFDRKTVFAGISPSVVDDLKPHVSRVVCWPNAIDLKGELATLLDRDAALEKLGLSGGPFTVGVVGRLHPKKRPELALEAFRQAGLADARLVFVGDGPLRGRLEHGEPHVHFAGFIADAKRCHRAFDALLLTSGDAEAFGMVALEGLVAGVPVVCERTAGPADVLGELGVYCTGSTPAEIASALRDVQQRVVDIDAWKQQAEARVRDEFSVEALARRIGDELNLQIVPDA